MCAIIPVCVNVFADVREILVPNYCKMKSFFFSHKELAESFAAVIFEEFMLTPSLISNVYYISIVRMSMRFHHTSKKKKKKNPRYIRENLVGELVRRHSGGL